MNISVLPAVFSLTTVALSLVALAWIQASVEIAALAFVLGVAACLCGVWGMLV